MEFLFLDQRTLDELYPASSDFWETFRPRTAQERARIIWRMDRLEDRNADDQH